MITPDYATFERLCGTGVRIPVFREHLADMETPVSAFSRFAEDEYAVLLESVEGGEQWGRYSVIGLHPRQVFEVRDGKARLTDLGTGETTHPVGEDGETGFRALRAVMQDEELVPVEGLPRFVAGAVGFIGYETIGEFERMPPPRADSDWPTSCMMLTDEMAVFDNVRHTVKVVVSVRPDEFADAETAYADACRRIERIEERLRSPQPGLSEGGGDGPVRMESNLTQEEFCSAVRRVKEYIVAGDVIQTVLSRRFQGPLRTSPLSVYRALRLINPSPYTFFLKCGDKVLVGASPEAMVRLTGTRAETRPIAGTRPRGATEQEDRRLADELLADEKERAEHVMLVDLARNDLGRVARSGSVQVTDFMSIERYSHVMHIVSHVQAELQSGRDAFDLICATFPAGTLSGAPKIRAMEIIRELEPAARGPYGGAVGYIGYDGNTDLAITIRTLAADGDQITVQAGAGIVHDSVPENEWDETANKAQGMIRAIELAANGLKL